MDIWSLRVLEAVVSCGSVSGAAALVRRTQPQVSRIIAALEDELALTLFLREGRRLQPTTNCHLILKHGRKILDDWEHLRLAAQQLKRVHTPTLHVIGPPYAVHGLMPQVVGRLRHDLPNLELSLTTLTRQENGVWNLPSVYDVGVGILPFELPKTRQQALGYVRSALLVPAGHPLENLEVATAADIEGHPFISLQPAAPLRRRIDQLLEAEGIVANTIATVPDTTSALLMVMQGLGIAIGDAYSASHIGGESVRSIPFEPALRAQVGVFWPVDVERSTYADQFINAIIATLLGQSRFFEQLL